MLNNESQNAYKTYSNSIKTATEAYNQVVDGGNQDKIEAAKEVYANAKTDAEAKLNEAIAEISKASAMTDAEISGLNMQQTLLDQQKKTLETQLNAYKNELDNVDKAETDGIKNSTPKFS